MANVGHLANTQRRTFAWIALTFGQLSRIPQMKNLTLAAVLLSVSVAATAGPFGLDMGTPLAELNKQMKLKPETPAVYSTPSVPKAHPEFDSYALVVTPTHGLCKIVAGSKAISTSVYGAELVRTFSDFESALATKYGNPKRYDFLRNGSIWKEPREWMMGLLKKERTLESYWTNEDRELPDSVKAIQLQAHALSKEQAYVTLVYEFKNLVQCDGWIKSQKDSAL